MKRVFLGGTCEGYDWRKDLINELKDLKDVELFNPIVDVWDEEARIKENEYKKNCDISLYVITPYMQGCYSIAEAVEDSNKRPEKTVFCYIPKIVRFKEIREFTSKMEHSLKATCEIIEANGAIAFDSLDELVEYLRDVLKCN